MLPCKKPQLKRTARNRYYSTMTYQEYCRVFGPPSPVIKPLDDPTQDIPELCLQIQSIQTVKKINQFEKNVKNQDDSPFNSQSQSQKQAEPQIGFGQQKNQVSRKTYTISTKNTHICIKQMNESTLMPKKQRMRAQSDNSEYLIFNFLQRINQKGKKKIKTQ